MRIPIDWTLKRVRVVRFLDDSVPEYLYKQRRLSFSTQNGLGDNTAATELANRLGYTSEEIAERYEKTTIYTPRSMAWWLKHLAENKPLDNSFYHEVPTNPKHLEHRAIGQTGIVSCVGFRHGTEIWWVRHDDGTSALYCDDELEQI